LEEEVGRVEGRGHAIGGHWLHHRSERSMGELGSISTFLPNRERERERARLCARDAELEPAMQDAS
jgi:hypothetical protein